MGFLILLYYYNYYNYSKIMVKEKHPRPETGSEKEAPKKEYPELEELKARLEKLEAQLGKERILEEKEKLVKQEIKSYLRELQQTPTSVSPLATRDQAEEIAKFEPSQQVGTLVSLVFEKGLPEAISVARALNNPAILDEFHDTLVDHYYEALIKEGILKLL